MKQTLFILAIVVLIGAGLWYSKSIALKSNEQSAAAVGFIKASESSFDFGEVSMAAGKVRHEFKVRNSASEPVKITSIYSSCMCTEATLIKNGNKRGPYGMPGHSFIPKINKVLQPGEEAEVEAVFDPAAHGPAGRRHGWSVADGPRTAATRK